MSQKITPNIWCNGNAKEAAEFYTSVFTESKITATSYYPNSKEEGLADFQLNLAGKELTVNFQIKGLDFVLINAGPEFKPNPSISFMVNFDPSQDEKAKEHLDELWEKLNEGGKVLMPLNNYGFSEHYGWVQDKFGVSWQLILTNPEGEPRPFIIPSLMFVTDAGDKAEDAMDFYLSVFKNSQQGQIARYPAGMEPNKEGAIMFADFQLEGQWFAAMDASASQHKFAFNEGISLSIDCKDQEEIDYFWEKLSSNPENEQCGWCKDKFGLSWQIVPANMDELMKKPGAYAKLMEMKKLVIADF